MITIKNLVRDVIVWVSRDPAGGLKQLTNAVSYAQPFGSLDYFRWCELAKKVQTWNDEVRDMEIKDNDFASWLKIRGLILDNLWKIYDELAREAALLGEPTTHEEWVNRVMKRRPASWLADIVERYNKLDPAVGWMGPSEQIESGGLQYEAERLFRVSLDEAANRYNCDWCNEIVTFLTDVTQDSFYLDPAHENEEPTAGDLAISRVKDLIEAEPVGCCELRKEFEEALRYRLVFTEGLQY